MVLLQIQLRYFYGSCFVPKISLLITISSNGVNDAKIRANVVTAQPLPTTLIIGSINTAATAPSMHLKRLLTTVAAPELSGH